MLHPKGTARGKTKRGSAGLASGQESVVWAADQDLGAQTGPWRWDDTEWTEVTSEGSGLSPGGKWGDSSGSG